MDNSKKKVTIHIGDIYSSREPMIIHTILGSCVAVCLFDPVSRVGGMNHILLPGEMNGRRGSQSTRYGVNSMDLLMKKVLQMGGRQERLVAKIFGGANVLSSLTRQYSVGLKNANFAVDFLQENRIRIVSRDLGGNDTRVIYFHTDTGVVNLKRTRSTDFQDVVAEEKRSFRLIKTALNLSEEKVKLDVLKELINIGAGRAARTLNSILNSHIELNIPVVKCFLHYDRELIQEEINKWCYSDMAVVSMEMTGKLSGGAQLLFSKASARKLARSKLAGFGDLKVDDAVVGEVLKEIGNILINTMLGSLGNELGVRINFMVPSFGMRNTTRIARVDNDVAVILAIIRFTSRKLEITGNTLMTFKVDSFELLNEGISNYLKKHNVAI
ncbi:MAG: hypothetical protein GY859_32205 [Desulfobacterales bacterium]|nr:hypothetical protein [Desulfobacterales bacterium]